MRSIRLLLPLLAAGTAVSAKELDGVYTPAAGPCPTVEEAIAKMTLPEGYEVRNFAAEPMVINPVAMCWDDRGRLWVVELYEYPTGAKTPNEYSKTATDGNFRPVVATGPDSPRDRVVILEDTDNDGKADKRTVFVEGLNLATAVLTHPNGVFVGQAPNLFFFRDTDGDDRADEYRTVLTGFGLEDRHELLNSFTWGPDGWMYFTHGVFTHSRIRRPGEPDTDGNTLNAGIYRVRFSWSESGGPEAAFHEVYADGTSNPWGVDFDIRGNAFVEACVIDHLFHMAPGGIYTRQGGAPEHPYAYELLPSIVPKEHPRHFRAAYAGIQIYKDTVYPEDTHGHLFFGNIHDNAIHEEVAEPEGATFRARPVRDLLRANNGWFRPVSVQTGPDGFLWVMDWCDKYPCYQNAQANPAGVDREKGRIWRICYTGSEEGRRLAGMSRREPPPAPEPQPPANPSAPAEAGKPAPAPGPGAVALDRTAPLQDRIADILKLPHRDDLPFSLPGKLVADERPEIRGAIARAIGEILHLAQAGGTPPSSGAVARFRRSLGDHLARLAGDRDPSVRAEAVIALRRATTGYLTLRKQWEPFPDLDVFRILTNAVRESADADRTLAFHIWMALEPHLAAEPEKWLEWLGRVSSRSKPLSLELSHKAARRIVDTRNPANMDLLVGFLYRIDEDDLLTAHALDGVLKAQEAGTLKPEKADTSPLFVRWQASVSDDVRSHAGKLATLWGDPSAVAALMSLVLDPGAPVGRRVEAIRTVRRLRSDSARTGIAKLLASETPAPLLIEGMRAAAELGGQDLADTILRFWHSLSPTLRTTAAEVMVSRSDWAGLLLDAVEGKYAPETPPGDSSAPPPVAAEGESESGRPRFLIDAADIPATARGVLASHSDAALRGRAEQLLGKWNETPEDILALIEEKRRVCLEGTPDLEKGREIFTTTCAVCHLFHGGGQEVGPDLIGSGRSNLDALLANVIDPNQVIGNGYQNHIITTRDGRTLSGRIVEDTPTQVTLLGIAGRREVIPVDEIESRVDTGLSAMPMGFGALPDEDFRNLIWFILAPPEEGPLTPEKRHALSHGLEEPAAQPATTGSGPLPDSPDRESASLWQPDWQIDAPDFEGTPTRLPEFRGRKNILVLHPYDRTRPAALIRRVDLPAGEGPVTLRTTVASHEKGDWTIRLKVNGEPVPGGGKVDSAEGDEWKEFTWDLSSFRGRSVEIRLENAADSWVYEFSFWQNLALEY